MTTLNWGIIGLGNIANSFATYFNQPDGRIYGAASRSLDKAQTFADQYNIPHAFGSYAELLADDHIDIVYIATPHNYHFESIIASLEAGKHVFCEKAITMNRRQLNAAKALAAKKNLVLAEAMTIYHMPLFTEIEHQQVAQQLGALKSIQVSFGSYKELDSSNRFFSPALAGGAMLDIGVYALSFARRMMTAKPELIATQWVPSESGVDQQSTLLLNNAHHEMVTVTLNIHAKMPKQGVLVYENGYITVDDYPRPDKATLTFPNGRVTTIAAGDATNAMNYELHDFQEIVRGHQPNDTLELSSDVMDIMSAARAEWGFVYPFEKRSDLN
ncbi:Gfo/Idh/MocA family protein [Latilactobacillus graminis]|uniref:Oxidoreductase, NAD-binding Rossmann fold family protein n=2 Tax=Latilactobacillus graminis TaxID=60519 RepID=A0AA89I5V9_9LACO|nr:Gfo/Idh/MocA family oxidoreductase [Latilactobacillus graminis]KRM20979.1 oxidoreductase, NAD-binding Rossmann fold family protein [Latilactobacillus graminis DSM 20719]QFP79120.1 Gfo/Idh/MocA family oxidoreductase [Latilactobacillus graminis]